MCPFQNSLEALESGDVQMAQTQSYSRLWDEV